MLSLVGRQWVEEKHLGHLTHAKARIAMGVSGRRPRTVIIKLAQAKNKANKIHGVTESQTYGLVGKMNYNIPCFQTPISVPVSSLPHPILSAQLSRSCEQLSCRKPSWSTPSCSWRGRASFSSWVQRPFFLVLLLYSHYVCLYLKICIFWGKKRSVCSPGGMEKGYWLIIAVSALQ